MSPSDDLIAALEAERDELVFSSFGFDDAWAVGLDIVDVARKRGLAVAVDVTVCGQVLFHAALPGSAPDNDQWVLRKNRVVGRFHESSLLLSRRLKRSGKSIEDVYGVSAAEYAPYGGAVAIRVRGTGVVGTATVSGLPDQEDHELAAGALRRRLLARTEGGA